MSEEQMESPMEEQAEGPTEEELLEAVAALAAQMEEEAAKAEAEKNRILDSLGDSIDSKLKQRMGRRKAKEAQWLEAQKLYLGSLASQSYRPTENDPFRSSNDNTNVIPPECNIVRVKCEAAVSQTISYQFAAGDKNWDINPPAVVDVDQAELDQFQQQQQKQARPEELAAYKAGLMSAEIEYHLNACRYPAESRRAMHDWAMLGTAVMKKPLNSDKLRKTYVKTQTLDGQTIRVPVFTPEKVPQVKRTNPWFFYPDDSVTDIRKAEDSIEIHLKSKTEMKELLQRPDFMKDRLKSVLEEDPREYSNSPFNDPAYLTEGANFYKNRYTLAEYHGPLTKDMLEKCGLECDSEYEQYAEVWVVNGTVVKMELSNLEGCEGVPYCVAVWEEDPASIFGFGIPMLTRDQQRVVNETYKMMIDNAGISAGPQVIVDTTMITPAQDGLECTPFKVWYSTEYGADLTKAITFFTPPNAYEGLSQLFHLAKQLADEESSIPLMLSGLSTPTGAGDSATGMALMNQNATSPLFYKSEQWDDGITEPLITAMYDWEMQFNPKEEIKGTFDIDVRTSTSYLRNTQDMQKLQALRQEIAQGSPMGEWIKQDELAQVTLMGMRLPYKGLIKSPEEVAEERANAPQPPPDPALMKAETDRERLEVEKQRLAFDQQKAAQEAQHQERLANIQSEVQFNTNQTRMFEAQAQVIKANLDFQSSLAAIAQKDEQARGQLLLKMQANDNDAETRQFLAQVQLATAGRAAQQKDRALDIQEKAVERRNKQ